MKSKKAQYAADTAPFYLVFGIVLTILFLAFMFILAYYSSDITRIPGGLEYEIITQRLFSSNCFGYTTTELDVAQANIIDLSKFEHDGQQLLDNCYNTFSTELPAFKLKLRHYSGETEELTTKNWIDDIGFDKQEFKPILLHSEDKMRGATLNTSLQWEKVRFK